MKFVVIIQQKANVETLNLKYEIKSRDAINATEDVLDHFYANFWINEAPSGKSINDKQENILKTFVEGLKQSGVQLESDIISNIRQQIRTSNGYDRHDKESFKKLYLMEKLRYLEKECDYDFQILAYPKNTKFQKIIL